MPPPRKVDLLPAELKLWLHEELKDRGFAGFEDLSEALNFRLAEAGQELRIGKSAIHAYGQEYQEFVKHQEEASAWAANWMTEEGMADEAQRHSVLFQMLTTVAFKLLKDKMGDEAEVNAQELHFLGRMMKDVMASAGIREKLVADERERVARATKAAAASAVEKSAASMGLTGDTVAAIKAQILGVAA